MRVKQSRCCQFTRGRAISFRGRWYGRAPKIPGNLEEPLERKMQHLEKEKRSGDDTDLFSLVST